MYYSAASGGWQLLEERIDDDNDATPGTNRHVQYIWGPRYIDDLLCRRQDSDLDGEYLDDSYWYHCTDVQFSTVAILDELAALTERAEYDPYGLPRHHRVADIDGDGSVNVSDQLIILAQWGLFGQGDFNRDGTVDVSDLLVLLADWGPALPLGELSHPGVGNIVGWDGYLHAAFTFQWHVRLRSYEPRLGRWMERDPAGFYDSINQYLYGLTSPTTYVDPFGLAATIPATLTATGRGAMTGTGTGSK